MYVKKSSIVDPVLTIVIPTFRRSNLLKETLDSCVDIQNEFKGRVEIIVLDNEEESIEGKTETFTLLKQYQDPFISYWVNPTNLGMFGNWNKGIELSSSQWVTILHDDDYVKPGFVGDFLQTIQESDLEAFFFMPELRDERAKRFDILTTINSLKNKLLNQFRTSSLRFFSPINYFFENPHYGTLGVFFKKNNAVEIGMFNAEYYPSSDFKFFLEYAINFGKIGFFESQEKRCVYRLSVNESLKKDVWQGFIDITYKVINEVVDKYFKDGEFKQEILRYNENYKKFLILRMPQRFSGEIKIVDLFKVLLLKAGLFTRQRKISRLYESMNRVQDDVS